VPKAGVRQNPLLRWTQTVVERRAAIALRVAVVQDLSCTSLCNKPPQFRWITRLGRLEHARAQALDIHPVPWRRLYLEPLARKQIAET